MYIYVHLLGMTLNVYMDFLINVYYFFMS